MSAEPVIARVREAACALGGADLDAEFSEAVAALVQLLGQAAPELEHIGTAAVRVSAVALVLAVAARDAAHGTGEGDLAALLTGAFAAPPPPPEAPARQPQVEERIARRLAAALGHAVSGTQNLELLLDEAIARLRGATAPAAEPPTRMSPAERLAHFRTHASAFQRRGAATDGEP
jgi:hypothetical protein